MSAAADSDGSVTPEPRRRRGEGTPPQLSSLQQPKMSPRTPDRASPYQKGACFTCQQEGHWSRDCPFKNSAGKSFQPSAQLGADGGPVEAPECTCGAGPCAVLVSRTENNPGRKFFRCPAMPCEQKCKFFQWCDSPSPCRQHDMGSLVRQRAGLGSQNQWQVGNTLQQGDSHPMCRCGAGWCIVLTIEEGEHAGRKYFSCPKKKCEFSEWCDEFNFTAKCMERPNHQNFVSPTHGNVGIRYPDCKCGAGRCRLLTKELGEDAGRKYFACPVKKGQGACNFFQWLHDVEGAHENGKNSVVGNLRNKNQHPETVTEPRGDEPFGIEPTLLNFDKIEVGVSNVGSDQAHQPSPIDQQQRDAGG